MEIIEHYPFVELGNFVVMPNHVHGIIIINKPFDVNINTQHIVQNSFGPQSKNLASIVRGFKIGVVKNARPIHSDFAWQPRFHDHIIRNNISFNRIQKYIINNPSNWNKDKFH